MDSLRNLDSAFQKVRIHALVTVLASLGLGIAVSWWAFDYANTASQRIYVLNN
jgi:hypothetical protein